MGAGIPLATPVLPPAAQPIKAAKMRQVCEILHRGMLALAPNVGPDLISCEPLAGSVSNTTFSGASENSSGIYAQALKTTRLPIKLRFISSQSGCNKYKEDSVDLWWNEAMQQQAFCRLYRIGQEKDVQIVKVIVKVIVQNSIDDYILQL